MSAASGYKNVRRVVPDVQFVDTLPAGTAFNAPGIDWESVATRLESRPGKWARIVVPTKVWASPPASILGLAPFRPKGSYEAVAQNGVLYMRKRDTT